MQETLTFHERQHLQKLLLQQGSVKYLFDEFVRKVGVHMTGWTDTGKQNIWIRNARIENAIEKELQNLHDNIMSNIENYSTDAWKRSNLKNDELVSAFIENLAISDNLKNGLFARNEEVLRTFLKQKVDDLNISERVWKIAGTAKENIEFYLESGLSTGRPAALISQDVRQLLQDPDKRFRRIRDKNGKLIMSKPMANYEPGTGVYRSSFKNAMRLAVSNTNAMYRIADHDRWERLPFIKGFDIKRSASARDECPICDSLTGRYPKGFLFKGWHPWCICVATPVLMDEDDFIDSLVDDDFSEVEMITDIPGRSREYLEEMLKKENIDLDSYLFKENKKFFE